MGGGGRAGVDGRGQLRGARGRDPAQRRRAGLPLEDLRRAGWVPVHVVCGDCPEAWRGGHHCHYFRRVYGACGGGAGGRERQRVDQQGGCAGGAGVGDVTELPLHEVGHAHG